MRVPVSAMPRHVLMSADALGGVWQYACDLAGGLARQGIGVTLAVLGPAPTGAQREDAEASGCRLIMTGLPLDWTAALPSEIEDAGETLARLAETLGADLVHLHSPAFAAAADFAVPVIATCHSCVATWWEAVETGPLPPDLAWRRDLVGRGCTRVDALLAPSAAFAAATARLYGLPLAPGVIHNGRRPAKPDTAQADPAPFAFTAGRLWDRAKNLAALDRIAACLAVPVHAAGPVEGQNGERIALPNLRLLGRLDDAGIATQLAKRPIFVSLARYEPFGLAVLEAAQAGCALVLSDIPTFRELWDGAAVFADPEDEVGTARVLDAVMADPERRTALGEAARQRAGRYSVDAMAAGVADTFRAVLAMRADASRKEAAA
jgi:glycosyltransferase involved in cell wall biosynthesis